MSLEEAEQVSKFKDFVTGNPLSNEEFCNLLLEKDENFGDYSCSNLIYVSKKDPTLYGSPVHERYYHDGQKDSASYNNPNHMFYQ